MPLSAYILAGGLGTRLQEVLPNAPKPLATVHGRPFLTYILDQLECAGIRLVVLCIGHLGNMIVEAIGESYGPVRIRYSQEPAALGTAGALRLGLSLIRESHFLVLNGDSFCEFDFREFSREHVKNEARCSLVLTKVANRGRFGSVFVDRSGNVVRFAEKHAGTDSGWINAGIYLISRDVLEQVPIGQKVSLEREVFPGLIGNGLYGFRGGGRFLDIGTPDSLQRAGTFFGRDE